MVVLWLFVLAAGVALIVWGAESFAENLAKSAVQLGVGVFALALLLAGAEPEELATGITASLRGSPGIALGDVVGANVTICLVALGIGAIVSPLPFSRRVIWYALGGVPIGITATAIAWGGDVPRLAGAFLVLVYLGYVATIWRFEHAPPSLGEVGEVEQAETSLRNGMRLGREVFLVIAGALAMIGGAWLLVEGVRQLTGAQDHQTALGLTLVGFATGFELVVLAWSAARRGATDVVVASVVGSFSYNLTMTLGASALVRPLSLTGGSGLHVPLELMVASLIFVLLLAAPKQQLGRRSGFVLLGSYPLFLIAALGLN